MGKFWLAQLLLYGVFFAPLIAGYSSYLPLSAIALVIVAYFWHPLVRIGAILLGAKVVMATFALAHALLTSPNDNTLLLSAGYSIAGTLIAYAAATLMASRPSGPAALLTLFSTTLIINAITILASATSPAIAGYFAALSPIDTPDPVALALARPSGYSGIAGAALSFSLVCGAISIIWTARVYQSRIGVFHFAAIIMALSASVLPGRSSLVPILALLVCASLHPVARRVLYTFWLCALASLALLVVAGALADVLGVTELTRDGLNRWVELMFVSENVHNPTSNSIGALFATYNSLDGDITLFGSGDFGRAGGAYLPDPGIIRFLYGAGLLGTILVLGIPFIAGMVSRNRVLQGFGYFSALAGVVFSLKEWWFPAGFGAWCFFEVVLIHSALHQPRHNAT